MKNTIKEIEKKYWKCPIEKGKRVKDLLFDTCILIYPHMTYKWDIINKNGMQKLGVGVGQWYRLMKSISNVKKSPKFLNLIPVFYNLIFTLNFHHVILSFLIIFFFNQEAHQSFLMDPTMYLTFLYFTIIRLDFNWYISISMLSVK